eukprot:4648006-Amphidinium_carterae.1
MAAAQLSHVRVHEETKEVNWLLPVSKTDVCARGAVRTWRCVCSEARVGWCPYHCMIEQLQLARSVGDSGLLRDPYVFPTDTGEQVTKEKV